MSATISSDIGHEQSGSPLSIQGLAAQLKEANAVTALGKVTTWLVFIGKTSASATGQWYENVDALDNATQQHQHQIVEDYLDLLPANVEQEKQLWETAHHFWVALSSAYIGCMAPVLKKDMSSSTAAIMDKLPMLAARATRALGMQVKWTLFRSGVVEPSVWKNLAHCRQFSEAYNVADSVVQLYSASPLTSSPAQEFLRAMMLSMSTIGKLSLVEQEIASRWIRHFLGAFNLAQQSREGLNLCFDLDSTQPPHRRSEAPVEGAHRRFFGAADALRQIPDYLDTAQKVDIGPMPSQLPKGCEMAQVAKVLEHLMLQWGEAPPRQWDRRSTVAAIETQHGFDAVVEMLKQAEQGAAGSSGALPVLWAVDDVSRGGYRAIVPDGRHAWLRLGALVATRVEYREAWSIAVIRRMERDEFQQHKVGLGVIARNPAAGLIRIKSSADKSMRTEACIILNTRPSRDGGVHILMRPDAVTMADNIEIIFGLGQNTLSLTPSRIVEANVEFNWTRYTVTQ